MKRMCMMLLSITSLISCFSAALCQTKIDTDGHTIGVIDENITIGHHGFLFYGEEKRYNYSTNGINAIIAAAKAIEDVNINIVITIVPVKSRIYRAYLPHPDLMMPPEAVNRYSLLLSLLREANINAVDLNAPLLAATKAGNNTFFTTDDHWLPYGALVAAKAVSLNNVIRKSIKDLPVANFTLAKRIDQRFGDLIRFLPPKLASQFTSIPYQKFTFTPTSSDQELLSANDPKVVLVGTSYSEQTYFKALEYSIHREIIDFSISGGGLWNPLAEYLKSKSFAESKPKLIIWELPEYRIWEEPPSNWLNANIFPYLK